MGILADRQRDDAIVANPQGKSISSLCAEGSAKSLFCGGDQAEQLSQLLFLSAGCR